MATTDKLLPNDSTAREAKGTRSLVTWVGQTQANLGKWHLELDFQ